MPASEVLVLRKGKRRYTAQFINTMLNNEYNKNFLKETRIYQNLMLAANKTARNILVLMLALALAAVSFQSASIPLHAAENHSLLENLPFSVDERAAVTVRTIHGSYAYNRYVSLRDMAAALSGTPKSFNLTVSGSEINLFLHRDYTPVGGENTPFITENEGEETRSSIYQTNALGIHAMNIDGEKARYHNYLGENAEGQPDAFLCITDIAMILDVDLWFSEGILRADTSRNFIVSMDELQKDGFFLEVRSALVGDATEGIVYTESEADLSVPIASTTKLMTLLLIMDAIRAGEISLEDNVSISENAAALSETADGVIPMKAGMRAGLMELLYALMLPSSNESALALAERICDSEEAFVARMNDKARELGFSEEACFYNCHGLPIFTDSVAASKIQNHMSARDMFLLVSHLLNEYPQVTEITSTKEMRLPTFDRTVNNTNPLLYNMPNVVGLKTGTTNASGASLVSAAEMADTTGRKHIIVAIEYGAEDASARNTVSQILLRYGCQVFQSGTVPVQERTPAPELPEAEMLVRKILGSLYDKRNDTDGTKNTQE
ncbi:MAG: D-alanyl-D-alanine carboxypeptidase [Lachnospiraceae bacterium]|nr:D-alanyl-D-alanine carboxypeptidase [Lachnospiraceae bacterium]